MSKIIELGNKLIVDIDEKYVRNIIENPMDDLFIGAIKYLREIGKPVEFFGFNVLNGHVLLIDGIKYCTSGTKVYSGWWSDTPEMILGRESLTSEEFFIVEDLDHDYIENRFKDRVNKILNLLANI